MNPAHQPHTLATPPPPQLFGAEQSPQWMVVEQPSEMSPQVLPASRHVVGLQVPTPQTLGTPAPPQLWPPGQPL